jgi:hypothetical protein
MDTGYVWVDMNTGRVYDPNEPYRPSFMPPPPLPIPLEERVKRIRADFDPIHRALNKMEW